ncbi:MAG: hypothetical protein WCL10_03505 [Novosphingobium sp.]|uniref:hypothetical protein n=1 Tax=Novosphingobium sp. TaxID=1874826 RepID=UPI0030195858
MSKIAITPIGTCRIATPLRRGAARYPIHLNLDRVYGFVHTTEEALQQLAFMQGERSFGEEVLPLLFRPGEQAGLKDSVWQPSDINFIEVSSAKSYRVGETAVQSNYLTRYFADFFASTPRARRFWALASEADRAARAEMAAFLKADPVYKLYSESDRALLSSISMRMQGFDEILQHMGEMVERLGAGRVVFVTHVNASAPDGAVIPSRDKVIRWVKLAAERLGTQVFDPTSMMRDFGQERAMERQGLDTTHYTNVFADRWYTHAHREYVLPRILEGGLDADPGEAASPSLLAESIGVAIEYDDFFDGARQLFAALAEHPDNAALGLLAGQVYGRIGDYKAAVRILQPLVDSPDMTVPGLIALMRAAYESGDAKQAVEIADRLLTDEYETIEVYEIAGLAAERLGRSEQAVHYGKLAFRLDSGQHRFATRVLDYYIASGESEQLRSWHAEVRDRLAAAPSVPLARALAEWAVVRRDEPMFRAASLVVARGELRSIVRLVEEAVAQGMVTAAAETIVEIDALPNADANVMRNFRNLAADWPSVCETMLAEGRIGDAYALATACKAVLPKNSEARRIERNVVLHLRDKIRAAQARGDHQAVIAMGEGAGRMLYRRFEIVAAYARSLLAAERGLEALAVARQGCAAFPDSVDLRGLTALIAASIGEITLALKLYGELRADPDPAALRYRERAERFFERVGRNGVKTVRTLVAAGDFEQAVELCGLLEQQTAARERISVELVKLRRVLRNRLRELDEEEDTGSEPMRILKVMLAVMPEDPGTLRRIAIEAMKIQDFESALDYWRELDRVSPGLESTAHNINRCQIHAQRQAARRGRVRPALAA